MSMLTMNGVILNVYDIKESTDKKTGELRPSFTKVQLQAENTLENGQKRIEMHDLKVTNGEPYRKAIGRRVSVPVGVFGRPGGGMIFYALNGGTGAKIQADGSAV
jgi:hypothetical protein